MVNLGRYVSPTGRACKNSAAGGGAAYCKVHACPTASCISPKSSKQRVCAVCVGSLTGSGGPGKLPDYLEPISSNPDYSSVHGSEVEVDI